MDRNPSIRIGRAVIFDEFLVLEELKALFQYTLSLEREFRSGQVYDPANTREAYRRALVSLKTGRFHHLIAQRIAFYMHRIVRALGHPYFDVSRVESQLTASNDGDYFRLHNDNTHASWPTREITYVYFFHREPRPFQGGELLVYDSTKEGGAQLPGAVRKRITPEQNAIVFFRSSCLHEILPVSCSSKAFADSRFTLNGWLHR